MADSSYIIVDTETQEPRTVKLIDNGDGTYPIALSLVTQFASARTPVALIDRLGP